MELGIKKAYTEVYEIIKHIPEEYRNKIPESVKNFFENQRLEEYIVDIDKKNFFDKNKLREETLAIIALLNLKYWCPNEEKKEQLIEKYNENERTFQKELEEKYNIDNIFKNRQEISVHVPDNMQIVEYKEPKWYQKIFKKILNIFKRK